MISHPQGTLSRAQLLAGILATGALGGCNPSVMLGTAAPSSLACGLTKAPSIESIFSDPIFKDLDKLALALAFDRSPQVLSLIAPYSAQSGRQRQTETVIRQIPPGGIVIDTPGTYTFGGNLSWSPATSPSAAITIRAGNVTLDLGGYTLTAGVPDPAQQLTGIFVQGTAGNAIANVTIRNGTIANANEHGVLVSAACGLTIFGITVSGVSMVNLNTRYLTPAGIKVAQSLNVSVTNCTVTQMNVKTDSSAGIFLLQTLGATVSGCSVSSLVNNDGAVIGFSGIKCAGVATTQCTAQSLRSYFNGNVLTQGHTVLGFCPIFCYDLTYTDCSASGLTGCCDDCHAMSVFLDGKVTVTRFRGSNVIDGVAASNSGAKATGLEVYGVDITVTDSAVSAIRAINPQDRQATGFSAWGLGLQFIRCTASDVSVQNNLVPEARSVGFGWAPDPRNLFCYIGAYNVTYTDCSADRAQVGFDTWYHVNSTWTRPVITNCATSILVEPGAKRTLSGDACAECSPPVSVTLTNFASGNTYPQT